MIRQSIFLYILTMALFSESHAVENWTLSECRQQALDQIPTEPTPRQSSADLRSRFVASMSSDITDGEKMPFSSEILLDSDKIATLTDKHLRSAALELRNERITFDDYVTAVLLWQALSDSNGFATIEIIQSDKIAQELSNEVYSALATVLEPGVDRLYRLHIPEETFQENFQFVGAIHYMVPFLLAGSSSRNRVPHQSINLPNLSLLQKLVDLQFEAKAMQFVPIAGLSSRAEILAMIANSQWPLAIIPPGTPYGPNIHEMSAGRTDHSIHDLFHAAYHSRERDVMRRVMIRGYHLLEGLIEMSSFRPTGDLDDEALSNVIPMRQDQIVDGTHISNERREEQDLPLHQIIQINFGPVSLATDSSEQESPFYFGNLFVWDLVRNRQWYLDAGFDPDQTIKELGPEAVSLEKQIP